MSALGQDFREDMVSIGKVNGEEGTERPEAVVESLAHVPDGLLVPFGQGRAGGVHEHVMQGLLHSHRALLPRRADEARDRGILQGRLLEVRLEGLEVLLRRFRDDAEIFRESAAVPLKKHLRALKHRKPSHRVGEERSIQRRVPTTVGLGLISLGIGSEVILKFLSVHEVVEEPPP